MIEMILEVLRNIGIAGLMVGIVIEAVSIPFPAALFVLVYGYILDPTLTEMVLLSLGSSAVYVAFSYIPYFLSIKYEPFIRKKVSKNKVKTAEKWIQDYGEWMIAVGRVLGMGYIAYIAGFSKIRPVSFGVFTFLGFFPLAFLMFYLGSLGNLEKMADWFQNAQWLIYSILAAAAVIYLVYRWYRRKGALVKERGRE
ncbi:VTT domain-containing protein [Bacillus sp. H-16]|uniref:DedA family protein n=1 Tax=Alteribacter salitolerans TaxID=2912333 RepID=UPI0019630253|nr:VTT domain-containing protein [Alteribacter salitolerans]MBM7096313.1 VTT domain-containing protein [Alteribacter salitolerans]